jgi:hypothetical protein
MATSPPSSDRKSRPHWRLVAHDIHFVVGERRDAAVATAVVACERRNCNKVSVQSTCVYCERFARIEPHEAGYLVLCRAADEEVLEGDVEP